MLFMCLVGILTFFAVVCFLRHHYLLSKDRESELDAGGRTLIIFAFIVLFIGLLTSAISWSNQIQDIEDLEKFTNTERIYRAKAQELTSEFAKYLAQAYPEHERAIFDKISPSDVEIYLVKYPELRSSDTILALTVEINKLQSDIYDQQLQKEEAKTNIRVRQRSPWYIHAMIPDGPIE